MKAAAAGPSSGLDKAKKKIASAYAQSGLRGEASLGFATQVGWYGPHSLSCVAAQSIRP
jgi:hypothetical protein